MQKKILLRAVLVLIAGLALYGCAAMTGIPKGSTLLGVYEGSFSGKFDWGTIEFKLYQTPGGTKVFTGSFMKRKNRGVSYRRSGRNPNRRAFCGRQVDVGHL